MQGQEQAASSGTTQGPEQAASMRSTPGPRKRNVQKVWLSAYKWLRYDNRKDLMHCQLCREAKSNSTMAKGTNNFRTSTITRHLTFSDILQNLTLTSLRSRLSIEHCDQLMRVHLEGGRMEEFDFKLALKTWREHCHRKIFAN